MLRLEGLANCKQTNRLPYLQTFRERRILDNTFCQIHAHICKQNLASGEEIMANLKSGQDTDNVDRLLNPWVPADGAIPGVMVNQKQDTDSVSK